MKDLIIPQHLRPGDKVATVSLSWGGAGDEIFRHRYVTGKKRLQDDFGVEVVEMTNTLKGSSFIYNNPKARADDLHEAFSRSDVKAVISCIGGDDSARIIKYVNFDIIRKNPKIFMGYSDTTVTNFICLAAGLRSFNGPAMMTQFAENVAMHDYSSNSVRKTLFSSDVVGEVKPSKEGWTVENLKWEDPVQQNQKRKMEPQPGWKYIQAKTPVSGRLIGGCTEVLGFISGTTIWPSIDEWKDTILFLENSEDAISASQFSYYLRNLQAQGIIENLAGIIFAKPCRVPVEKWSEYDEVLLRLTAECGRQDMPILTQMDFGHTDPIFVIPFGAMATIDPINKIFSIDEPGCAPRSH